MSNDYKIQHLIHVIIIYTNIFTRLANGALKWRVAKGVGLYCETGEDELKWCGK